MTITDQWVACFRDVSYEQLPVVVIEQAKSVLLDFLGVALGGSTMPMSRLVADYSAELGGRPEATVVGTDWRLPAVQAAFVNGVFGHALDMDDGHRAAAGHPGVTTLPAALAIAEREGVSGPELLRAIVCAYEVYVRLGAALNPEHLRRGFHTTATVGPFPAALAAGLLLKLNAEQLTRALGLAGIQGAGLLEVFHDGAMAKPFQTARASAAGVLAADLAARGAEGPRSIIEGKQGFLQAMAGQRDLAGLTRNLGAEWAILGVYFKEHAACRHAHAAVDAAAIARRDYGVEPHQVERVLVRTYDVAHRLCGATEPPRGISEAKFSLPYCVALGFTHGHARQTMFTPELINDTALLAIAQRVSVVVDPAHEAIYPRQRGASLDIVTTDGRAVTIDMPFARGEPEAPLSRRDLEDKFVDNAREALPESTARALIDTVAALDQDHTCATLFAHLRAPRQPANAAN